MDVSTIFGCAWLIWHGTAFVIYIDDDQWSLLPTGREVLVVGCLEVAAASPSARSLKHSPGLAATISRKRRRGGY
jgi:hypothetical protein